MVTIHHDSAGDTSQRCDKAPAHESKASDILTSKQLLARLAGKGIDAVNVDSYVPLLESFGYTHVVRYVPAHINVVDEPTMQTLFRDIALDHEFQGVLFALIIQFERSFKCHLANALAREFGELAHLERKVFKDEAMWKAFVDGSRSELIQKARKGSRYAARIASRGRQIPVWFALEFSSLGSVSKLYANLVSCDAKRVTAHHYGVDTSFVESWLASINFVRNECAHGGVLYGRDLEIQPRSHRAFPSVSNRRVFYQVLILAWVLERDFSGSGQRIVDGFRNVFNELSMRKNMGAPEDWCDAVMLVSRVSLGKGSCDSATQSIAKGFFQPAKVCSPYTE